MNNYNRQCQYNFLTLAQLRELVVSYSCSLDIDLVRPYFILNLIARFYLYNILHFIFTLLSETFHCKNMAVTINHGTIKQV